MVKNYLPNISITVPGSKSELTQEIQELKKKTKDPHNPISSKKMIRKMSPTTKK